jgi:hypothetical protein
VKNFLLGSILVLFPEHWRTELLACDQNDWRDAAVAAGSAQIIISLSLYIVWFLYSAGHWADVAVMAAVKAHPEMSVGSGTIGSLVFVLIHLHPLTWILLYFAYEGIVRTLNARARMPVRATLPLRLVDRTIRYAKSGEWREAPRLVRDEVTPAKGKWDLRIASCRKKPHWKYPLTIRYAGEFFQILGEEQGDAFGPRPYLYFFRRLPANETIKGLETYDPESVLGEEVPGFLATVYGEVRRRWAK